MKVKTRLKAGKRGASINHNAIRLTVKTGLKGGKIAVNHSRPRLKVRTGLKSGGNNLNHSRTLL
jgi:hypothetical protein